MQPHSTAATDWPPRGYAWYATFVLMLAYTLSYVDRQILSMLIEPIKADLQVSDTQVGLLQGFAFAIFYTLAGIPLGRLADRTDRRRLVAIGVFVWSLATALCGLAKTYWQLFLARVGVGVGEAALGPAAYSMLADYFPPERRGRAIGVYSMGVYLGIGLAAIIGGQVVGALANRPPLQLPLVGELAAWHLTFMIVGVPGLLLAAWAWTLREPPRRAAAAGGANAGVGDGGAGRGGGLGGHGAPDRPDAAPALADALAFVRGNAATFVPHFLGFSLLTLLFNAVVFWVAPYLMRAHGALPAEFGTQLGLTLAIGGAVGIYAGGAFADALRSRGVRDAELWAGIAGAAAVGPLGVLTVSAASASASLAWFAAFMLAASFPFAAAAAALQNVTPNRLRGLVSAIYLFVVNLTGIGLGSFLTGFVTDTAFRDPARVGESMAWIVALAAPAAAVVLFAGREAYRTLQARVAG